MCDGLDHRPPTNLSLCKESLALIFCERAIISLCTSLSHYLCETSAHKKNLNFKTQFLFVQLRPGTKRYWSGANEAPYSSDFMQTFVTASQLN